MESSALHQPRWYKSRNLWHCDAGPVPQFLTFRLTDSLPVAILRRAESIRIAHLELDETERESRARRFLEGALDRGLGQCWLADPRIARIVEDSLLFYDGKKCDLHAWAIMPNHLHLATTPHEGVELGALVKGWKSFTAVHANRVLGRSGAFWQKDYFDRFMRSERQLERTIEYIEANPVRAGLCANPRDWLFGSARRRDH